ncbi:MAG: AI-2E family transporter [Bacteroidales bacterium]|nr:AI-2E family transporter [Bacteroidales bacterium]
MNNIYRYIIIGVTVAAIVFTLWYFQSIVAYVLISSILSLIGKPLVDLLGKIKYKRFSVPISIRALITLIALWALVVTFFRVFIPLIAHQANELSAINVNDVITGLQEPIAKFEELYNKYSIDKDRAFSIERFVNDKIASFLSFSLVSNFFGSLAGWLGNIFIASFSISFITFFFLKDTSLFGNTICYWCQPNTNNPLPGRLPRYATCCTVILLAFVCR